MQKKCQSVYCRKVENHCRRLFIGWFQLRESKKSAPLKFKWITEELRTLDKLTSVKKVVHPLCSGAVYIGKLRRVMCSSSSGISDRSRS